MNRINDLLKNCYRKEDIDTKIVFYQTPKFLIHSDTYKELGLAEKLVYSILRDRLELSLNNEKEDFIDEDGYVFLRFDQEKLGELLNINKKTVGRYMKKLEEYELIVIVREGQGRSNRIYITDISKQLEKVYTYENIEENKEIDKQKNDRPQTIENALKGQNVTSRKDKMSSLEVTKSPYNDTDINNTDISDNKSISQSIDNNKIIKNDGQTDISKQLIEEYNSTLDKCDVYYLDEYYKDAIIHAIKLLFLDIENKKRINIGENIIHSETLRNDLKKLDAFVIEHAIEKFKRASSEKKIRNTVAYLKSCIYNSIHEKDLDIDSNLRYEGLI